jgi:hemin uptake protein HemP
MSSTAPVFVPALSAASDLSPVASAPLVRPDSPPRPAVPTRVSSQALLAGQREIEIDHDGVLYRLRQTSLGKLILTK